MESLRLLDTDDTDITDNAEERRVHGCHSLSVSSVKSVVNMSVPNTRSIPIQSPASAAETANDRGAAG